MRALLALALLTSCAGTVEFCRPLQNPHGGVCPVNNAWIAHMAALSENAQCFGVTTTMCCVESGHLCCLHDDKIDCRDPMPGHHLEVP